MLVQERIPFYRNKKIREHGVKYSLDCFLIPVDHVSTDIDWHRNNRYFVQVLIFSGKPKYRWYDVSENFRVLLSARHYAVLVSPNKDETFVHCAHSLGNLAVGKGDVPVILCIMLLASEKVLGIWALATHPSQHFQGSPLLFPVLQWILYHWNLPCRLYFF